MKNRDGVIRQAIIAAENHSHEVRTALCEFIAHGSSASAGATKQALRDALVAQSAGFETTAHDGSTYTRRVEAAKKALEAWDGIKREVETKEVSVGSRVLQIPVDLHRELDFRGSYQEDRYRSLMQALSENALASDEDIALRAVVLYQASHAKRAEQNSAERVAKLAFEAAEQNKIAEAINAKSRKG